MNRILIVGTSGSGKSTLARQLSEKLSIPHIELDNLQFAPEWQMVPDAVLIERVAEVVAGERWILDGSYGKIRHMTWPPADTLIWLDYPKWVVMWRVVKRTARRVITRERLWDVGNVERLNKTFSRESIIWWAWITYDRRRRQYPEYLAEPAHAHLTVIHHRTPRATRRWLQALVP